MSRKFELDDLIWLVWLLIIFLPYELYAAFTKKKGDTLSENTWDWFAIKNRGAKFRNARRFILLGFWVSLGSHFVFATTVLPVILFGIGMGWSIWYYYRREK
jgi:hypothetical protein